MDIGELFQVANEAFEGIAGYMNTIVIALVILLLGFILARITDRFVHKLFLRVSFDDICFKIFGRRRHYARATRKSVVYLIYIVTVFLAFRQLNLDRAVLVVVAVLFVLIIVASLLFAVIEIIPNLVARARLKRRNITVGDTVSVKSKKGTLSGPIVRMTLTDVHIKRRNGDIIFYPNRSILKAKLTKKRVHQ